MRPRWEAGRMSGHGFSNVGFTTLPTQSNFFLDLELAIEIYLPRVAGYEEIGCRRGSHEG